MLSWRQSPNSPNFLAKLPSAGTLALIEESAIDRQPSPASSRSLLTKLLGGSVRALILASAVCAGVWLGIRPHGLNARSPLASRLNETVPKQRSVCSRMKTAANSDIPPGYALVNIRRIGEGCFAFLKADNMRAPPALALGGGVADVFGPNGSLKLRFSAIERPNGQWELLEYRRLPVDDALRLKVQR